jgi:hypothetical protein
MDVAEPLPGERGGNEPYASSRFFQGGKSFHRETINVRQGNRNVDVSGFGGKPACYCAFCKLEMWDGTQCCGAASHFHLSWEEHPHNLVKDRSIPLHFLPERQITNLPHHAFERLPRVAVSPVFQLSSGPVRSKSHGQIVHWGTLR